MKNKIGWGAGTNSRGWGNSANNIGFGSIKSYTRDTQLMATEPEPKQKPNAIQKIVAYLFGKGNS